MADEGEPLGAQRRAEAAEKRRDRSHAALGVLLGGVLALAGGVVTTALQSNASEQAQTAQFREDRAQEDRDRRADTYFAFLDAANSYGIATSEVKACLDKFASELPPGQSAQLDPTCVAKVTALGSARFDFMSARSKVYVYGSSTAARQANAIAASLPGNQENDITSPLPDLTSAGFSNYDETIFVVNYRGFQRILCQELPAEPRVDC